MSGTAIVGNTILQYSAVPGWSIAGVGDYNGDSRVDILWKSSSGRTAVWLMNGQEIIGNTILNSSTLPGWSVVQ